MTRLDGRTAVITGATSGLGAALASAFWSEGASLVLVARNGAALAAAASGLGERAGQQVDTWRCDLGDAADLGRLVRALTDRPAPADILVNNAAIQGPVGPVWTCDPVEWRSALDVDLVAPVELCRAFVQARRRVGGRGKIINLSGGGATGSRPGFSAYATAKAGLVRFSETLADEVRDLGIDVNCMAPGVMPTRMTAGIVAAGADHAGATEVERARTASPETIGRAVALCVYLASDDTNGITGKLIAALWDPWEQLPQYRDQLASTDVYTLRRIVPGDRGLSWGDR